MSLTKLLLSSIATKNSLDLQCGSEKLHSESVCVDTGAVVGNHDGKTDVVATDDLTARNNYHMNSNSGEPPSMCSSPPPSAELAQD